MSFLKETADWTRLESITERLPQLQLFEFIISDVSESPPGPDVCKTLIVSKLSRLAARSALEVWT